MSVRLVILGFLRAEPLHGYELKRLITEHLGDWTSIAFGSIYFALTKLKDEGFLTMEAVERHGRRPSRNIYRITEAGRAEFQRLLRQVWEEPERTYYTLDIGLFFMDALPRAEILSDLDLRLGWVRGALGHIGEHQGRTMAQKDVPARAQAIFDHTRLHLEAELTWLEDLRRKVANGEY